MRPLHVLVLVVATGVLVSGCLDPNWENVDPADVTVTLEPDDPVAGEPVSVVATAPERARFLFHPINFRMDHLSGMEVFGTTTATGTEARSTMENAAEGDVIFYWAGVFHRDGSEIQGVHLTPTQVAIVGPQGEQPPVVTLNVTPESPTVHDQIRLNVTVEGSRDPVVEGKFRTVFMSESTRSTTGDDIRFEASSDGRHHEGVLQCGLSRIDPDFVCYAEGAAITIGVIATDPETGAIGHATQRIFLP